MMILSAFEAHSLNMLFWQNLLVCFTLTITHVSTSYLKVFQTVIIEENYHCSRLLNETGSIGCDGPISPVVGVLLANITTDQIECISKNTTDAYYPFIPVLSATSQNLTQTLLKLNEANRIAGVLIVRDGKGLPPDDQFPRSDDVACPNEGQVNASTAGDDDMCYRWINSPDDTIGTFFHHWKFPIFHIDNQNLTQTIFNCTLKWNSDLFEWTNHSTFQLNNKPPFAARCAAELYQPNYAPPSVSASRCLQQTDRLITLDQTSYCENILVNNLLVPLLPMSIHDKPFANGSIFLLVARMDSLTLFTGKSPAADSVFSALIAVFAVADALAKNRDQLYECCGRGRQVMFAFYSGESLGNIGSSFHAYDLDRKRFHQKSVPSESEQAEVPLSTLELSGLETVHIDQIGYLLELNQLAVHGGDRQFWLHERPPKTSKSLAINESSPPFYSLSDQLIESAQTVPGVQLNLASSSRGNDSRLPPIPPSSVHGFEVFNSSDHIEMAVITNHEKSFSNRYYHSVFDNELNVLPEGIDKLAKHLASIATVVSRAVASFLVNGSDHFNTTAISANVNLTRQLVKCIFTDRNCSLLQHIQRRQLYNETANLNSTDTLSEDDSVFNMVYDIMVNLTGKSVPCPEKGANSDAFQYVNFDQEDAEERNNGSSSSNNTCTRYQAHSTRAISPYFLDDVSADYQRSRLSQWVLSHRQPLLAAQRVRLILLPSRQYIIFLNAIGVVLTFGTVLVLVCFCC